MSEEVKLYVVIAETGEYEDYREHMVKAYRTEDAANAHASLARDRSKEIARNWEAKRKRGLCLLRPDETNEYDPPDADDYHVETVELADSEEGA